MEPQTTNADLFSTPASADGAPAAIQSQPMAIPTPAVPAATATLPVPQVADDTDIIEPEWVNAVRNVINAYRGDPYNLNTAVAMLRREYLSKRYGKDIEQGN